MIWDNLQRDEPFLFAIFGVRGAAERVLILRKHIRSSFGMRDLCSTNPTGIIIESAKCVCR